MRRRVRGEKLLTGKKREVRQELICGLFELAFSAFSRELYELCG